MLSFLSIHAGKTRVFVVYLPQDQKHMRAWKGDQTLDEVLELVRKMFPQVTTKLYYVETLSGDIISEEDRQKTLEELQLYEVKFNNPRIPNLGNLSTSRILKAISIFLFPLLRFHVYGTASSIFIGLERGSLIFLFTRSLTTYCV